MWGVRWVGYRPPASLQIWLLHLCCSDSHTSSTILYCAVLYCAVLYCNCGTVVYYRGDFQEYIPLHCTVCFYKKFLYLLIYALRKISQWFCSNLYQFMIRRRKKFPAKLVFAFGKNLPFPDVPMGQLKLATTINEFP